MAPPHKPQELEAGYIGFILGARSGFEPKAMLSLLHKLRADGPSRMNPHPSVRRRLQQALTMPEAADRVRASGIPTIELRRYKTLDQ